MAMATKRARGRVARGMVTATRVVGDKEGNGEGGKSDGDGNKEGHVKSGKSNGNRIK
jgi:hypothetical protein